MASIIEQQRKKAAKEIKMEATLVPDEPKIVEKKKIREEPPKVQEKTEINGIDLSLLELEFLIRLIGGSNFKGNDLMFVYELVKKLQQSYMSLKGE
tara:strand:- start:4256 stop:4543 length:288 start_codon:yes stop_codon:yes gene_type:complete